MCPLLSTYLVGRGQRIPVPAPISEVNWCPPGLLEHFQQHFTGRGHLLITGNQIEMRNNFHLLGGPWGSQLLLQQSGQGDHSGPHMGRAACYRVVHCLWLRERQGPKQCTAPGWEPLMQLQRKQEIPWPFGFTFFFFNNLMYLFYFLLRWVFVATRAFSLVSASRATL